MPNHEKASSLFVKSFFAASIPAAIEQAQRELGPDALLLNAREAPPEARHLGAFEVAFGACQAPAPAAPVAPPTPAAAAPAAAPAAVAAPESSAQPALRKRPENRPMRSAARYAAARQPGTRNSGASNANASRASRIDRVARRRNSKLTVLRTALVQPDAAPESWAAPAVESLADTFRVQPEIGRITALVGPPGSGKTTTLVKLAVNECLKLGRPVRLISTDTVRIGGAYQLRTYAGILGVPFQAVEDIAALAQAIDAVPANTYVLIDTPGLSVALQHELGADLAEFLRHRQDIDTHLVLTASMAEAELQRTTDRFAAFTPSKLIFTRLDESTSTASVVSEASRVRRPVSFLCNGQSVPEDILPASKDLILSSLAHQLPDPLQAVA